MNAPAAQRPTQTTKSAWVPLAMQEKALACGAYELFCGGAKGPGKSEYLVVAPLRWVGHPEFRAVLFRNSYPELEKSLILKSFRLYKPLGAVYNVASHQWRFPSGATVEFAYLERDSDLTRYQGLEYSMIGWDELPHFTEHQYRTMQSCLRSTAGLPPRVRATGNPDGPHLEWVRKRFAPWIDGLVPDGEARWFDPEGRMVPKGTPDALSRSYIRGRLSENHYLPPEYRAQLMQLDPVTRAKFLDGDWDACVGEGKLFHRTWWSYLDAAPLCEARVRAWDLGAGGDPTEGVLLGDRGPSIVPRFVVLDCITHVGPPHEVHALVRATAVADGKDVPIALPQDPGQAGKDQAQSFGRELPGFTVRTRRPSAAKVVRAGPWSSQVGARNAALVRGPWNAAFVAQHHAFPDGPHDDKVDAASDAFAEIMGPTPAAFGAAAEALGEIPRRDAPLTEAPTDWLWRGADPDDD